MPISAISPPPAMSPHITKPHASSRPSNAGQSLADLYNSRHAEEIGGSSSRVASSSNSSSLADLYNQRHDAETRKDRPTSNSLADLYNQRHNAESRKTSRAPCSTSLADLYNQRYETEQLNEEDDSIEEVASTQQQVGQSRAAIAGPSKKRPRRAASINSSDGDTPEPQSLMPSHIDELGEEEDDEDDIKVDSAPRLNRDRSHTRSESVAVLPDGPEVVYVHRPSIHRRGALGASATRLTMESDEELGTPEPEAPSSSAPLAHPHPASSKLVVQSASESLDQESGLSTPPIPPTHRKGTQRILDSTQDEESMNSILQSALSTSPILPSHRKETQPITGSTQDEDSLNSMLCSDSAHEVAANGAAPGSKEMLSDVPRSEVEQVGPSDVNDTLMIRDSSRDQQPQLPTSPQHARSNGTGGSRSGSEQHSPAEGGAIVMLPTPTEPMRERIAEEADTTHGPDARSSPSLRQTSPIGGGMQSGPDTGVISEADSDMPIITDARIKEVRLADSSANATSGNASDSDGHRCRYPRRARNVTDYNVRRAFEALEYAQENPVATASSVAVLAPMPRSKKTFLPVVDATAEFFEALNAQSSNTVSKEKETGSSSFADFLMAKAKADIAAAVNSTTLRSADQELHLTEAQALAIPKLTPTSTTISRWDVSVNQDDRGSLYQLKPSTRRWLGIGGSGPLDTTFAKDEEPITTPPQPGPKHRLGFSFSTLISSHLEGIAPSTIREALETYEGTGPIGRPREATELESASRRLRLGRAFKLPLPPTLSIFTDKEHDEWVRLEEFLPEMERMVEEKKAKEEGKVLVEVGNDDRVTTQWDAMGRKRLTKLRTVTGGEVRVWFDLKCQSSESERGEGESGESQEYKIVRVERSPRKSPSVGRLGSAVPRGARDVQEEEEGEGDVFGGAQRTVEGGEAGASQLGPEMREESQMPLFQFNIPPARKITPPLPPQKAPQAKVPSSSAAKRTLEAQPAPKKATEPQPAAKLTKPAPSVSSSSKSTASSSKSNIASSSKSIALPSEATTTAKKSTSTKPNAPASKGATRDLLSYFSTQNLPPQPSKLAAKGKGKTRAHDDEIRTWNGGSSRGTDSEMQVVVDLTHSSSASDGFSTRGKRIRSPSPSSVSSNKRKALPNGGEGKGKKQTVGLGDDPFVRAEAKRREIQKKKDKKDGEEELGDEVSFSRTKQRKWPDDDDGDGFGGGKGGADSSSLGIMVELPAYRDTDERVVSKRKRVDGKSSDSRHTTMVEDCEGSDGGTPPLTPPLRNSKKVQVVLPAPPKTSNHKPTSNSSVSIPLPNATPSPSRGGWKGISNWYTNTRDTFSPTPADQNHPSTSSKKDVSANQKKKSEKEKAKTVDELLRAQSDRGKSKR